MAMASRGHVQPNLSKLPSAMSLAFEAASLKVNPPRVVFDNHSDPVSTLVKVDSANKQGCLLHVVQLLTDLDLIISKAYISSDGGWFVDVFHVVDQLGRKVTDHNLISFIQKSLGASNEHPVLEVKTCLGKPVADAISFEHTAIELTGFDRPGLLNEVSEVISKLECNVVGAEVWTHNHRVALVLRITSAETGGPVSDPGVLSEMQELLCTVTESNCVQIESRATSLGEAQTDRRLHQLLFAGRDYEVRAASDTFDGSSEKLQLSVTISNSPESQYTIIKLRCQDRPKLLFDTVCTLTDMQYIIHHATIESAHDMAFQEYFIRTMNGAMLDTEAERDRVVKCLEAAILRRSPEGVCLDLCTGDRTGLLSDVTRVFKAHNLSITAANICTRWGKAINEFYVTDSSNRPVDFSVIEAIRKEIGSSILTVRNTPPSIASSSPPEDASSKFSLVQLSQRFFVSIGLARESRTGC